MESLTITRPVVIKVRVTDEYKRALSAEIRETIGRMDLQLQQMEFQASKDIPAARQRLEEERQRRLEIRQQLVEKLKEVGKLAPGEEVVHGRVESLVELKVGDDWRGVMGVEVVLEDDKVIEIRRGS